MGGELPATSHINTPLFGGMGTARRTRHRGHAAVQQAFARPRSGFLQTASRRTAVDLSPSGSDKVADIYWSSRLLRPWGPRQKVEQLDRAAPIRQQAPLVLSDHRGAGRAVDFPCHKMSQAVAGEICRKLMRADGDCRRACRGDPASWILPCAADTDRGGSDERSRWRQGSFFETPATPGIALLILSKLSALRAR